MLEVGLNTWWLLALIGTWLACLTGGYEFKSYQDKAATEAADIAALKHVNTVETKDATITEDISDDYRKKVAAIVNSYTHPVIVQPPVSNLPKDALSSGCSKSKSCQWKSDVYGLTWQQCDTKYAGYNALWDAWNKEATADR